MVNDVLPLTGKIFFKFLVAPSLRAERLIWSLWRVSVWLVGCTSVSHRGTPPLRHPPSSPPPGNHRISKIPKPKFVSAYSEQLFQGGTPPLVKGKFFDTRFGLIHVQTGKKNFHRGPPLPVKGKNFDTRFGLIHVQTGKKIFQRDLPPHKGENF